MPERPQGVSLPVVWVGVDEQPILSVNQFLGQVHDGDIYLTLGVVTPPVLPVGDDAIEKLSQMTYVPARPTARVALTKPRLDELVDVLQQMQVMYETERQREDVGDQ